MNQPALKHAVATCLPKDVEATLDEFGEEYDLVGMTAFQVGTGFGARIEVLLAFRLKIKPSSFEGALAPGRLRRSPMVAVR